MGLRKGDKKSSDTSTSPCANLRAAYDNCFYRWYSEQFLKGQWDKEGCVSEWQKYRACLSEHLDDKNLRRYLEGECGLVSIPQEDSKSPVENTAKK